MFPYPSVCVRTQVLSSVCMSRTCVRLTVCLCVLPCIGLIDCVCGVCVWCACVCTRERERGTESVCHRVLSVKEIKGKRWRERESQADCSLSARVCGRTGAGTVPAV